MRSGVERPWLGWRDPGPPRRRQADASPPSDRLRCGGRRGFNAYSPRNHPVAARLSALLGSGGNDSATRFASHSPEKGGPEWSRLQDGGDSLIGVAVAAIDL